MILIHFDLRVIVSWALFAYVWLYLILVTISPGVVHLWEGLLTLSFFPMTVITAYITDKKLHGPIGETNVIEDAEHHRNEYVDILRSLRQQHPDADIETIEKLTQQEIIKRQPKSMGFYRIQAMQKMTGGGDITKKRINYEDGARRGTKIAPHEMGLAMKELAHINVHFDPASYSCFEDCEKILVSVICERKAVPQCSVSVDFRTEDGTAPAHVKYIPIAGTLTFDPDQTTQTIGIGIIDNDIFEEDQTFFVHLSNPKVFDVRSRIANPGHLPKAQLQSPYMATVTIVDNDHAGVFEFEQPTVECSEEDSSVSVRVRKGKIL